MLKYVLFLLMIVLVQACESEHPVPALIDTSEKVYRDTSDGSLCILFDGKYIFSIGLGTYGSKPDSLIAWTAGCYTISGDTIFTFFPPDSSSTFRTLNTKYFYVDTTQGSISLNLHTDSSRLLDSLLHATCENCSEAVSIYGKTKAILSKDQIHFLPMN